jgi:hypothetical protein
MLRAFSGQLQSNPGMIDEILKEIQDAYAQVSQIYLTPDQIRAWEQLVAQAVEMKNNQAAPIEQTISDAFNSAWGGLRADLDYFGEQNLGRQEGSTLGRWIETLESGIMQVMSVARTEQERNAAQGLTAIGNTMIQRMEAELRGREFQGPAWMKTIAEQFEGLGRVLGNSVGLNQLADFAKQTAQMASNQSFVQDIVRNQITSLFNSSDANLASSFSEGWFGRFTDVLERLSGSNRITEEQRQEVNEVRNQITVVLNALQGQSTSSLAADIQLLNQLLGVTP